MRMKSLDLERRKNEKLNDLEEEAKEQSEYLLTKANEMRQEQEDEIKHLNEVYHKTRKKIGLRKNLEKNKQWSGTNMIRSHILPSKPKGK